MIGQTLGHYRVDSLLGEGGMGKVYKAYDHTLGRTAALKILPAELVHDAERLERFTREARTASALNHPNVVTIYEVGRSDDQHYIAMELVEGETLRQRLMRGPLELPRALELVAQVADGVATAHAVNVTHRDLKPENIVVAKNGYAKILDFGLAKLQTLPPSSEDGATAVRGTTPGVVLGTVGYMAPEQAKGEEVDHRADIFAIGCILYEAVTGQRSFRGDSSVDVLHKIIYSEPKPITELTREVPHELQRIVRKSLAKDPDHRYQSAKDLALDLRELKQEVESQPRGLASATKPSGSRLPAMPLLLLAAMAVGIVAALVFFWRRERAAPPQTAEKPAMSITRLTNSGNVIGASISPDGEYLAYVYSDAAQHSLWVRQIATASALELEAPRRGGYWGLTFTPDSRSIYYGYKSQADPSGGLYQIPILGGQPRLLLRGIDSQVRFSADGKQMVFLRQHSPKPGHSAIIVANADGTSERSLASKAPPESLQTFWGAPAWSHDGQSIITPVRKATTWRLMRFDVQRGTETLFSKDEWGALGDVQSFRDGSGLLVIGSDSRPPVIQIWFVARDGTRRRVTNDLLQYRIVNLTEDDKQLLTVAADTSSALWKVSLDGKRQAKLTNGREDGFRGVAAAEDGTIYFITAESGRPDIWSLDARGNRRRVTLGEWASQSIAVSPDQKYLVTTMPRQNDWVVVRMERDGSAAKVLSPVVNGRGGRATLSFTSDSKFVIFDSAIDGVDRIWKVPIDGGNAVALREGDSPAVSPDGTHIAYLRPGAIEVAPIGGGAPQRFENVTVTNSSAVHWSPDGNGILHNAARGDRINIWLQPLDGSEPRKVTNFDDEYVHRFDVTPDGKEIVLSRGVLSRDAVLIKNFR